MHQHLCNSQALCGYMQMFCIIHSTSYIDRCYTGRRPAWERQEEDQEEEGGGDGV